VSDSGIGIAAQDVPRIFERFFRADAGRARDKAGAGLGLAIVRQVAADHDGEVVVSSQEGRGSTFTLRLPIAVPATVEAV
jgi:two-component system sensor histidine kinase SenX3